MMIPEIARYRCVTGGAESGPRPSVFNIGEFDFVWLCGSRRVPWLPVCLRRLRSPR